jgi:hypothetical protein
MPASERPGPVTGDPAFYSSRASVARFKEHPPAWQAIARQAAQ